MALMNTADLTDGDPLLRDGFVYHLVAQHEAQHQETMLQALDLRGETSGQDAEEVADADDPRLRIYLPATGRRLRPAPVVDDTATAVVPGGPFAFGAPDPADLSPTRAPCGPRPRRSRRTTTNGRDTSSTSLTSPWTSSR